jgi:hypothetical protein
MIRPISSVLVDFHRLTPQPTAPAFEFDEEPPAPTVDVDELVREAEERGFERGRGEAMAESEEASAAAAQSFDEQLQAQVEAARAQWAEEEGARLADRLDLAMTELRDMIATHTADILQALVAPAVRERMVGEVVQAIETLTRQDATMLLRVEGPADLLEAIRKALSGRVRSLDLVQAEGPDVKVIAQDTIIESQLGAWVSSHHEGEP